MTTFVDHVTLVSALWFNTVEGITTSVPIIALAAVTPAANKLPYFSSAGAAATTTMTAFARTLLDDSDAATMRTTLGVTAFTLEAKLAAIAALAGAADTVAYFTGASTASLATFTATGRSIVASVNAAAALAAIAGAPLASPTFTGTVTLPTTVLVNNAITGIKSIGFNGEVDDGNSGAAKTISFLTGQYHRVAMTLNCTFTFTAPAGPGVQHIKMTQDATGGRVMTLPASVKWASGADTILSTGANARDLLILKWDGFDYTANLMKNIA